MSGRRKGRDPDPPGASAFPGGGSCFGALSLGPVTFLLALSAFPGHSGRGLIGPPTASLGLVGFTTHVSFVRGKMSCLSAGRVLGSWVLVNSRFFKLGFCIPRPLGPPFASGGSLTGQAAVLSPQILTPHDVFGFSLRDYARIPYRTPLSLWLSVGQGR